MPLAFPGESAEYRAARDLLLEQEIELRRAMEAVAVASTFQGDSCGCGQSVTERRRTIVADPFPQLDSTC